MKNILLAFTFALLALSSYAGTVTLAWDKSSDPNVTGYRVYEGASSRNYTNIVDARGATTVTVSNLLTGVKYFFAATAYTAAGLESDYSAEVSYTISNPIIITNPPSATTNKFGSTVLLSVGVTGGMGYQWYKGQTNNLVALTNGGNLSGVLTTTLTISNVSWLDNGTYSLQVSNTAGSVFSSGETVYVSPPPPSNIRATTGP